MRLTIIGAGPAYTNRRGAAASSYLLQAAAADGGTASLVLDLGQGSFSNLAAEVEPSTLTAVLVSHLHPDHFIDLVALRHYLKWEFNPSRRVAVLAPASLAERLDVLDGHPGFTAEALDVGLLEEGIRRVGPFEVEACRVTHTEESYAFRVSVAGADTAGRPGPEPPGRGLVFSGDCEYAEDFRGLIRRGDTLLAEASFGPGPVAPGARHITSADAARAAKSAGAGRLLLTHILASFSRDETLAAARAAFDGEVRLVTEGDQFEV